MADLDKLHDHSDLAQGGTSNFGTVRQKQCSKSKCGRLVDLPEGGRDHIPGRECRRNTSAMAAMSSLFPESTAIRPQPMTKWNLEQ